MPTQAKANTFGTFGGVFTPCTLTILGVIMFLRFGQVVGQAGVVAALAIIALSKLITTLTSLSLAAVATNTRVRGGGAYWLISRSLGVEFGGAIGLVFFLAQAVSVAMYVIGFTEAFLAAFPALGGSMQLVASVVNLLVFVCVYIGAGWTIKLQYGILAILGLSLASFWIGAAPQASTAQLIANATPSYTSGQSFFTMFALFFPAATGIMAGANMSGDLKDPARSIPRGTLASVAVTAVIYLGLGLTLGAVRSADVLIATPLVMTEVAWLPWLITAGIFAATLSSALGSMMGAPRILQALARDAIFPSLNRFARGSGQANEPRTATILTFVIAQAAVLLGDLDLIAPIITMFFMLTYGTLNLASFYESVTRNPSYRPRFRWSHWSVSLLGALGCVAAMMLIAPLWGAIAMLLMAGLHHWISRSELEARWGDVRSGVAFERARTSLLRIERESYHPKNWRPAILAMSGEAGSRLHLAVFGHWLAAGHGLLVLGQVISGSLDDLMARRANQERLLRHFIRDQELGAFTGVVVAEDLSMGVEALVQCTGIGGFRMNTVLFGWSDDPERAESFGRTLRRVAGLGRSLVILRSETIPDDPWLAPIGTIDVWWRGNKNGPLLMLLAHLLVTNAEWRARPVRVLRMIGSASGRDVAVEHLQQLIEAARIPATPVVIVGDDIRATVRHESRSAGVVLFGFEPPAEGAESGFIRSLDKLAADLDHVLFVSSAGGMELDA